MSEKELLLSDRAIEFLQNNGAPVCSNDFIGYLFRVYADKDIFGRVTNEGEVSFYRADKKPVGKTEYNKHLAELLRTGFIQYDVDVFPEFSNKKNIPMNPQKTLFIEETLFS